MRLAIALVALITTPALAQDPSWPQEFNAMIEQSISDCDDGEFSMADGTVQQADLNGDGTQDWVLDANGFQCSTAATLYCGTAGCTVDTLIDGTLGSLLLHDWATVTENGTTYLTAPNDQGETARFLWTGSEWQIQ